MTLVYGVKGFPGTPAIVSDDGETWTFLDALEPQDVDTVRQQLGSEPSAKFLSKVSKLLQYGPANTLEDAVRRALK